jgi:hypothetical protein
LAEYTGVWITAGEDMHDLESTHLYVQGVFFPSAKRLGGEFGSCWR